MTAAALVIRIPRPRWLLKRPNEPFAPTAVDLAFSIVAGALPRQIRVHGAQRELRQTERRHACLDVGGDEQVCHALMVIVALSSRRTAPVVVPVVAPTRAAQKTRRCRSILKLARVNAFCMDSREVKPFARSVPRMVDHPPVAAAHVRIAHELPYHELVRRSARSEAPLPFGGPCVMMPPAISSYRTLTWSDEEALGHQGGSDPRPVPKAGFVMNCRPSMFQGRSFTAIPATWLASATDEKVTAARRQSPYRTPCSRPRCRYRRSPVTPPDTSALRPVNFLSRMKFTTPATASEP